MTSIIKALRPLASAAMFYYATLWLVALVVVGTVAQKYFGLQASLEKYFSAWFIQPLDMPLYLPSGRFTMAVILMGLIAKMAFSTKWKIKMIGINITHFGVLVLLLGGVLTAYTSTEGNIAIKEGQESSTFSDFHAVEIAVTDRSPADYDQITTFTDGFSSDEQSFTDAAVPFTFKVNHFFKNCEIVERPSSDYQLPLRDRATKLQLKEKPSDKDDRNLGGVEIVVSGASEDDNGIYLLLNHPQWGSSTIQGKDGKNYALNLRFRHYELPFSIHLKDFEKLDHAGTSMARAYSSKVTVKEGASSYDTKIYMNHPLRSDGYTLYQADFDQRGANETSVFQVVYNKGRYIPYIAVLIVGLGLLIHIIIQIPRLLVATSTRKKSAN